MEAALDETMGNYLHQARNLMVMVGMIEVAEKLNRMTPDRNDLAEMCKKAAERIRALNGAPFAGPIEAIDGLRSLMREVEMSEDAKAVTLDSGAVIEAIRRASAQFRALRRQDESEAPKDETPVVTILKRAMRTHLERHRTYGAGDHDRYGAVCAVLFPEGLTLRTPEEFARFHLFSMIVAKLNRYSANYVSGGHPDSVHDQGVYSFLLEAYDEGTRHGR